MVDLRCAGDELQTQRLRPGRLARLRGRRRIAVLSADWRALRAADRGVGGRATRTARVREGSRRLPRTGHGRNPMRVEPSKLAQLVNAYHQKFGRYVPARVLRLLDAAPIIQDSLATGVPLSETEWGRASPMEFSPR